MSVRRVDAPGGWWVVASGSVLLLLQFGLIIAAFGAYLVSITADTGWSPTVIAIGFAILQLGNGFIAPVTGWCCDRFGTRAVARTGTLVSALGFAVASSAATPAQFLGAVVVVALGCSAAGIMPLSVAVVQVLPERRTLALGLLPSGIALGGLAVPLVALALESLGWRATFLAVAAVTAGVGLIASQVLPRHRTARRSPDAGRAADVAASPDDPDLGRAVRTTEFWVLVLGHGGALVAVSAINLHLVPLLISERSVPLTAASFAVAAMAVAQLAGQLLSGALGDRVDKRRLAAGCMAVQCLVLLTMATTASTALLVGAASVHGLAWGLRGPVMTAMRADYFGLTSFGVIMGWSMGLATLGQVIGPLLVAVLVDRTGNYSTALDALIVVSAFSMIMFLVLRRPALVPARDDDRTRCTGEDGRHDPGSADHRHPSR